MVGFLTGVGIQVAAGQIPDMLGVSSTGSGTFSRLWDTARALPQAQRETVAISIAVILVVVVARRVNRRAPGALIAVIGAIVVSRAAIWPLMAWPCSAPFPGDCRTWDARPRLAGCHRASGHRSVDVRRHPRPEPATSRAYAVKYEEPFSEETDLVGLGAANVAAAFSGTFVVNGSPTKTQMVDGAGGRTQLASLTTAAVVLIVLLILTGPLASLPSPPWQRSSS